jgi:hypothetical protein
MKVYYLYKMRLCTDQASGDLMMGVASCFYRKVYDIILECLMAKVWKLKKPIDDRNTKASNGHQKEERKRTHDEMLIGCFDCAKARKAFRELNKRRKNKGKLK